MGIVFRTCGAAAHSTKTCEKLSRPSYRVVRALQRSRLHSVSRSMLRRISNASSERSVDRFLPVKRHATVETCSSSWSHVEWVHLECAAIIAMFSCPSWSSKDPVASPERLTTAVPSDVDQVTTEVVPVVAEDPTDKLQHMLERVMVCVSCTTFARCVHVRLLVLTHSLSHALLQMLARVACQQICRQF